MRRSWHQLVVNSSPIVTPARPVAEWLEVKFNVARFIGAERAGRMGREGAAEAFAFVLKPAADFGELAAILPGQVALDQVSLGR